MTREVVLEDQTVVVRGDRIVAVGAASEVELPRGAVRVDAAGLFLTPALADMHVHLEGEAWNALLPPELRYPPEALDQGRFLFPYVANGIATIAVMSATDDHLESRRRVEAGETLGPRMVLGRMIDGPDRAWPEPLSRWVATPEAARAAVHEFHDAGFDRMKVYSFLSREVYDAILDTAKGVGLPVDGHIPMDLSVEYVLQAGQDQIVHSEEIMKHVGGDYGRGRIEEYADLLAASPTWLTPTLVVALDDRGKPMMAGSDAPVPTIIPGFSLHEELEELVGVGFSPYEALADLAGFHASLVRPGARVEER